MSITSTRAVASLALFSAIREIRSAGVVIPLIVMTYYNPILAYGQDGFVKDVAKAGADGLIAIDVPPEEAHELSEGCQGAGLDFVPLAKERYDLVMRPRVWNSPLGEALGLALRSPEFQADLTSLGGYDTRETGQVQRPPQA